MKLDQTAVVLRQRSGLEVVELALLFVRRVRPDLTWRLMLLFLSPLFGMGLALRYSLDWPWPVVLPTVLIASWLVELPFLVFAGQALFSPRVSLGELLHESRARLLPFLGVILFQLGLLTLWLPTVVGPLFAAASYCFGLEAVTLERASTAQAIGRAKSLLRSRSGVGIQVIFLKGCLTLSCILILEVLGQTLWEFVLEIATTTETLQEDGGSAFALGGLLISVPLTTAYRFLAYINERTIQDGWDLQVAFLSLAKTAPAPNIGEAA